MKYFRVVNLKKYQHYSKRNPPWIKLYYKMLEDYKFCCLRDASKAHLMLIWLLASRYENRLPYDPDFIAQSIKAKDPVDLESLKANGFIKLEKVRDQSASDMLADREQSAPLREQRTENREQRAEKNKSSSATLKLEGERIEKPFVMIPVSDGDDVSIMEREVVEWEQLFGNVNVRDALNSARAHWLTKNRNQRKTSKGIRKSLVGRLDFLQNKARAPTKSDPLSDEKRFLTPREHMFNRNLRVLHEIQEEDRKAEQENGQDVDIAEALGWRTDDEGKV